MSFFPTREFLLEVARGKIAKHTLVRVVGLNPDIDSASEEDVVAFGGSQPYYSAADTLEIVSSSTADTNSSGIGARQLRLSGLNGSHALITEDINLNGTTVVTSSNSYLSSVKATLLTSGANETNSGDITIRDLTSGTTLAYMPAGFGRTLDAVYTVPAAKTGYIISWHSSIYTASDTHVEMRLMVADDTVGWRLEALHELDHAGTSVYARSSSDLMIPVKAKGRIRVRAKASADNTGVASEFAVILIDN